MIKSGVTVLPGPTVSEWTLPISTGAVLITRRLNNGFVIPILSDYPLIHMCFAGSFLLSPVCPKGAGVSFPSVVKCSPPCKVKVPLLLFMFYKGSSQVDYEWTTPIVPSKLNEVITETVLTSIIKALKSKSFSRTRGADMIPTDTDVGFLVFVIFKFLGWVVLFRFGACLGLAPRLHPNEKQLGSSVVQTSIELFVHTRVVGHPFVGLYSVPVLTRGIHKVLHS